MKTLHIQKVKGLAGSEKYFLELLPKLNAEGIQAEIVCFYEKKDESHVEQFLTLLKDKNIQTHFISYKSDFSTLHILRQLKKIIKQAQPNIIHSHLVHADFWCALLKRFFRINLPIVSTKHGYEESYIAKHGFDPSHIDKQGRYYRLCKFSEKRINQSIAVSNGLKKFFIDAGISKKDRIKTIHHGFDLPEVSHLKNTDYRFSDKQLVVLGRIIPFKGHEHLFNAMPVIVSKYPKVKLLVLGTGDDDLIQKLKEKARNKGFEENVNFLGFKTNIYDYLVNSDIMIVPSIAEGFGLIFLEAMNAKTPIIGFDVPATNEIILDNETGYLIKPYDVNQLADKINYLLEHPNKRNELATKGYEHLKNYFSLQRMTNQTIDLYQRLLHETSTKGKAK